MVGEPGDCPPRAAPATVAKLVTQDEGQGPGVHEVAGPLRAQSQEQARLLRRQQRSVSVRVEGEAPVVEVRVVGDTLPPARVLRHQRRVLGKLSDAAPLLAKPLCQACQVQTRGPGGLGKPTRVPDVPTLPTLARVPPPHEADLVADRVCRTLGAWLTANGAGAEACLAALGFTVENDDLGASAGGHQAMLLPRPDGGFTVLVDPDLTPDESRAGADPGAVREGRLWHEFAHSLFYAPGTPPRRAALTAPHEESFCDAFAEGLGRRYGPESAALRRNG